LVPVSDRLSDGCMDLMRERNERTNRRGRRRYARNYYSHSPARNMMPRPSKLRNRRGPVSTIIFSACLCTHLSLGLEGFCTVGCRHMCMVPKPKAHHCFLAVTMLDNWIQYNKSICSTTPAHVSM